jgi:hypothetical protein
MIFAAVMMAARLHQQGCTIEPRLRHVGRRSNSQFASVASGETTVARDRFFDLTCVSEEVEAAAR